MADWIFVITSLFTAVFQSGIHCSMSWDQEIQDVKARLSALEAASACSCAQTEETEVRLSSLERASSNTIAFSAYRNSQERTNYNAAIVFDTVDANLGNAYDSATGIFTCPVNGYYMFSVFVFSHADGAEYLNMASINIGGTVKNVAFADQAHADQGAMTVITRCDAGTQVYAQNKNDHSTVYGTQRDGIVLNNFIGFLVSIV